LPPFLYEKGKNEKGKNEKGKNEKEKNEESYCPLAWTEYAKPGNSCVIKNRQRV